MIKLLKILALYLCLCQLKCTQSQEEREQAAKAMLGEQSTNNSIKNAELPKRVEKLSSTKENNNILSKEISNLKNTISTNNELYEKNLNDQKNSIKDLKIKIETLSREKDNLSTDTYTLRNELNKLTRKELKQ